MKLAQQAQDGVDRPVATEFVVYELRQVCRQSSRFFWMPQQIDNGLSERNLIIDLY